MQGGTCSAAAVAVGGLVPTPDAPGGGGSGAHRQAARRRGIANAAAQAAGALGDDVLGDIFASAEYRRAVAGTYVRPRR